MKSTPLILTSTTRRLLWLLLGLTLLVRLVAMATIPLADTSEARYGEIARKMAETGDWITLQFQYGVPFWAKPPLSTWLSAIGIKLFGVNEFSVRLPSLLMCMSVLALIWQWIAQHRSRDQALLTIALLAHTVLFASAAGAVMTDPSLLLCTTLTMIAFWNTRLQHSGDQPRQEWRRRGWGYLFFVGLGIGLLAKGPVVGVLTFFPIATWAIARNEWRQVWRQLPWLSGTLLMLVIAAPWYVLAEIKTPGFLHYFIIGEHLGRFIEPAWRGDKYGNAHAAPIGAIWLYWLYAAFPFSVIALGWMGLGWMKWYRRRLLALSLGKTPKPASLTLFAKTADITTAGWSLYLLSWGMMPLLFFTIASNVVWTYALTSLPAFACLVIELQRQHGPASIWRLRGFLLACSLIPIAGIVLIALHLHDSPHVKPSQRKLVQTWQSLPKEAGSTLVYFNRNYPSALFYSQGKAESTRENAQLEALLDNNTTDFIAVKNRDLPALSPEVHQRFHTVARFNNTLLMQEIGITMP